VDNEGNSNEASQHNIVTGQANYVVQARDIGKVVINPADELAGDQPPVIVTAELREWKYLTTPGYIVDMPPDQLPLLGDLPDDSGDPGDWPVKMHQKLMAHSVQSETGNALVLTVEGRTRRAVILKRLRIHVLNRGPGTRCGIYAHFPTNGYSMSIRNFVADLRSTDVAIVRPTGVHGYDNDIEMTPEFPYMVHSVEPEQFVVNLDYGDEDVTWVAVLDWLLDGKSEELRIDNAGEPFVSTSFCTRPIYTLGYSDWRWHLRSQTFKEECHPFRRR
jgi:hypothetical protein